MKLRFKTKILLSIVIATVVISKSSDFSAVYGMKRAAGTSYGAMPVQIHRGGSESLETNVFSDCFRTALRDEWFGLLDFGDVDKLAVFLNLHGKECVNWVDKNGVLSLNYAACYADERVIKFLLANGADINSVDVFGHTPLMYAVERFCDSDWFVAVGVMHTLCESGADPTVKCAGGNTVLHIVSEHGFDSWRQIFLNMGVDDNEKNDAGFTPKQLFDDYRRSHAVNWTSRHNLNPKSDCGYMMD